MAKMSRGNLALHPGRNGIVVAHGLEYVGKLVHVRADGIALVEVPSHHFKGAHLPAGLHEDSEKPSVLAMSRAKSRAPSWIERVTFRAGALGQQRLFSAQASQSILLARYL